MLTQRHRFWRSIGACLLIVAFLVPTVGANTARADTEAINDTPTPVVNDTDFNEWTLSDGLLYWASRCYGGEFRGDGYLKRRSAYGTIVRTLSEVTPSECETYLFMVADSSGLYFYTRDNGNHVGLAGGYSIYVSPSGSPYSPHTKLLTPDSDDRPVDYMKTDDDYLYWRSQGNRVLRMMKDGTGLEVVTNARAGLSDILVYGSYVFFLDDSGLYRTTTSCGSLPCPVENLDSTPGDYLVRVPGSLIFSNTYYWVTETTPAKIRRITCSFSIIVQPPIIGFEGSADEATVDAEAADDTCGTASDWYTAPETPTSTPSDRRYYQIFPPATGGGYLFWRESYNTLTTGTFGRIRRMAFSGGGASNIATDLGAGFSKVLTDDLYVYFTDNGIKKLPFNASAIVHDLKADAIEVTQGIQNLNNDAPLVAEKTTYVRGYGTKVSGANAGAVTAYLYGERGGSPLPGSPLTPLNGVHSLTGTAFDRSDIDDSWLFQLPSSWRSGVVEFELKVDPVNSYDDPNTANNSFTTTETFEDKAAICAVFIPVRTHAPAASTDLASFWPMLDMAERMLPTREIRAYKQNSDIAELQVCWAAIFPYPCYGPYELKEDKWKILTSLWTRDQFSDDPDSCDDENARTHYIGLIHPSTSTDGLNGSGRRPGDQLMTKMPALDAAPMDWRTTDRVATLPHELGHNYDRKHVDCGGPADPDTNYPYTNPDRCRIDDRSLTASSTYFGFDIAEQEPIAPDSTRDLMAYGSTRWPSDYTFRAIDNKIDDSAIAAAGADLLNADGTVLISGDITKTAETGELGYAWVMPNSVASAGQLQKWAEHIVAQQTLSAAEANAAAYKVRLIGAGDALLAEETVELFELEHVDNDNVGFGVIIPEPAQQVIRIELVADSTVIDTRSPGTGAPAVAISSPAGGETIDMSMTVNWTGTDPDADDVLLYNLQYTPNNGAEWRTLISDYGSPDNLPMISLNFPNLDDIPGSNGQTARIRVIASDGYNTTIASSELFTVPDRKPQPHIITPEQDRVFEAGTYIQLRGGAYDPETGLVDEGSLAWQVNGQAAGTGKDLSVGGLASGAHTAQLTATDIAAQSASTSNDFSILPLRVPSGASPIMDGLCNDTVYDSGTEVLLMPYGDGSQASVRIVRGGSKLYACFAGLKKGNLSPGATAGLRIDVNNSQDAQAQGDDYAFLVAEDGSVINAAGNGAGGFDAAGPGGVAGELYANADRWQVELGVDSAVLGGWDHLVSLTAGHYDVASASDDYVWPYAATKANPSSWSEATLGNAPTITNLDPYTVTAGSPQFELTVHGANFVNDADTVVYWGAQPLPTTYVDATEVHATVAADKIATPGRVSITVHSPGEGMVSNPLRFDVVAPAPVINSITPDATSANASGFDITVNGANYANGAKVLWNGLELPTTYVNAGQLTATVAADKLGGGQIVGISVLNPAPMALASNVVVLTVDAQDNNYLPSLFKQ